MEGGSEDWCLFLEIWWSVLCCSSPLASFKWYFSTVTLTFNKQMINFRLLCVVACVFGHVFRFLRLTRSQQWNKQNKSVCWVHLLNKVLLLQNLNPSAGLQPSRLKFIVAPLKLVLQCYFFPVDLFWIINQAHQGFYVCCDYTWWLLSEFLALPVVFKCMPESKLHF